MKNMNEALSGKDSAKLRRDMKKGVVEFSYKKKSTGSIRKAKGTLKKSELPKFAEDRPAKPNMKNFVYWDTEKNQFRCFNRENFIQFGGSKENELDKKGQQKMSESDYIDYIAHMLDEAFSDEKSIVGGSINEANITQRRLNKIRKMGLGVRPFSKKELDGLIREYGETKNFQDAGWILPDGRMLNMHRTEESYWDHNGNQRRMDGSILDDPQRTEHECILLSDERDDDMNSFCSENNVCQLDYFLNAGFIRIDGAESASVETYMKPTPEQIDKLYDFADQPWDQMRNFYLHKNGIDQFAADIGEVSIVYDDIYDFQKRLINDIRNYSSKLQSLKKASSTFFHESIVMCLS